MRVLGICRFSYPAVGGFRRMHNTIAAREAYLYAPERMEIRFRHFEALTLPSITAQKDGNFTFLMVIGENMPKPYRDRLHDLTAGCRQIRIVTKEPMRHRIALQEVIRAELGEDDAGSIQFRLDDDDAVSRGFVKSLRRDADLCLRVHQTSQRMAIEYNNGFSAMLSADGIVAEQVYSTFWACGLGVVFRPGDPMTIMNFAHHKLHHSMPLIIRPESAMYIRAKHEDNDSRQKYRLHLPEPLTETRRALFKRWFNVDEDHVRKIFSSPVGPPGTA